jgi:hypothetical protein
MEIVRTIQQKIEDNLFKGKVIIIYGAPVLCNAAPKIHLDNF